MATVFATPLDNVITSLASSYTLGGSSVAVADGTLFGSPSVGAPVRFTMIALAALDAYGRVIDRTKVATYRCSGRSGNTLMGVMLDSGTDQSFAAGDVVAVLVTATTLSTVHTAVNALEADYAPLASPTFTGTPAAPTASPGTNTTQLATTAFTTAAVAALSSVYAPIVSPALTGTPTAPTAAGGTNTTQVATTAFVTSAISAISYPVTSVAGRTGAVTLAVADVSGAAPLASPTLTGTPTAPTASAGTSTTQLATTAFVASAVTALPASAITTGQLATARGGTGVDGSGATNGQLLIGNGSGYSLATLTQGANVTITNGAGTITIAAATGGGGSPGGSSGNLQYNSSGSFAGLAGSTVGGSGVMVSLVSQAATDVGYQFVNHASQTADPYRVLAADGSTVNARITKDGYVCAGTSTTLGAITAKGGSQFSGLPAYGTASIGNINQTDGGGNSWAGSGFVFANTSLGNYAFSMVCNADIAFFGWLAASGPATIGMVFNPSGLGIGIDFAGVGTNRLDVNGGLALGSYAGSVNTPNGILCPGTVGIGLSAPTGKLHVVTASAAQQLLIVDAHASQTANLTEWRSSGGTVYGSVSENGYYTTRKTSAPADGELAANEVALWFDSTNGAAKLMIKGKSADGTVVTGSVTLT